MSAIPPTPMPMPTPTPTPTHPHSHIHLTNRFSVSSTGQISLIGTVDREQRDTYFLTLIASDGGGTLANPNRAVTLLNITVLDFNDNPPVFPLSSYQFSLVEGTAYPNILTLTVGMQHSGKITASL